MTLPLILLPGMMCDARLFTPQVEMLRRDWDVSVPALTGHETMETLAEAVLAEAPARFALAGLSMGGIVAMEVVRQAPDRVDRLALLDTNPFAELPEVRARRGPQIEKVRRGLLSEVMQEDMIPQYLATGPSQEPILDLCLDMALALGPEVFIQQSIALRDRPDQTETLRAYPAPSLVLCGQEDALCPVERHESMHGLLAGSTLEIVEGAGHLPTLEKPGMTTRALRRWLAA